MLVHGAWAGPSGWDDVEAGLHKDGYTTVTPTLGLASLEVDVATVRATLDSIPGKKVLVGHSYGGADISNAAYGRSDVLGLVYTAAFVPDEGQTLLQLGEGYQPPAALPHLIFSGPPFASPSLIVPAYFRGDFAQDLNPKLAATLSAQQRPTDFSIFVTPSGPVAWHSLPSWYAVSGADRMIDPTLQRAMAQRIGATTGEEPRPLPRVTRSLTLKIRWKDQEGSPNRKGVGIENAYGRPDNRQTMDHSDFRILGLAASLRQASFHRGIVRAAHEVAPEWMSCDSFDLGSIPYFNQDLEDRGIPEPVRELREKVRTYDAVLIATPEYDYAIPGVLASALDWCLRSRHDPTPFRHKPVGIAGASPGGAGTARGQMVLRQILLHPPAYVMPEPQMLIPFSREKFDGQTGDLVDNETRRKLRRFLTALVEWTRRVEEPKQADRRRDLGGRMA